MKLMIRIKQKKLDVKVSRSNMNVELNMTDEAKNTIVFKGETLGECLQRYDGFKINEKDIQVRKQIIQL
jgi:hypothetical protein